MKTKATIDWIWSMVFAIFLLGFVVRVLNIHGGNVIIGFDQARDLFASKTIWSELDLRIIGPTAGNNTNLHHGIAWLYFILPAIIIFGGNTVWVSAWSAFVNCLSVFVLFIFATSLFESKKAGLIAGILTSFSFYLVSYSGWLSNPSPTLVVVPLFFFGLWKYIKSSSTTWALPVSAFFLGLSIQFELFFLYLFPTAIIIWLIFRPKLPNLKVIVYSLGLFCLATATMIATEIKYGFSGVFAILGAGSGVQKYSDYSYIWVYVKRYFETIAQTVFPNRFGTILGVLSIALLVVSVLLSNSKSNERKALVFLSLYLFSSALMLLLGYHSAPWFLIGLPPAVILLFSYLLSKIKNVVLLFGVILVLMITNLVKINSIKSPSQMLLEPDRSAIVATQLAVVDYTYGSSNGEKFTINTLTNPLYINAVWAWHYDWYGKGKYGYTPSFAGGEQLPPYNTLVTFREKVGEEKYLYLIMDTSSRIPPIYTIKMLDWADEKSTLLEERVFPGIVVQKRVL